MSDHLGLRRQTPGSPDVGGRNGVPRRGGRPGEERPPVSSDEVPETPTPYRLTTLIPRVLHRISCANPYLPFLRRPIRRARGYRKVSPVFSVDAGLPDPTNPERPWSGRASDTGDLLKPLASASTDNALRTLVAPEVERRLSLAVAWVHKSLFCQLGRVGGFTGIGSSFVTPLFY